MVTSWLQILAKGKDVHTNGAEVIHGLQHFLVGFAQAQHQAGLGQHLGAMALGVLQHAQGLLVACTGVAYFMGQAFDCLDILREHFKA